MKRWIVLIGSLLALLLLLGCSVEQIYLGFYIDSQSEALAQPAGTDETPITFTIESGQSVAVVAGNLKAMGLIKDTELFRRYVQYKELDAGIQAGTYTLNKTMTIPVIAQTLQKADAPDQQITIPEGKRLEEVAAIVEEQTNIPADAFLQMAQTGWQGADWSQKYGFLAQVPVTATLEGLLFPDTYRLPTEATAYDLIDRMLGNFERQVTPEMQQQFTAHGLTFYEGITLASIVEREAVIDDERPDHRRGLLQPYPRWLAPRLVPDRPIRAGLPSRRGRLVEKPTLLQRSGDRVAVQHLSQPGTAACAHRQPGLKLHPGCGESHRDNILLLYGGLQPEQRQSLLRGDGSGAFAEFQRVRRGDHVAVV